jgi:hypothetical protein
MSDDSMLFETTRMQFLTIFNRGDKGMRCIIYLIIVLAIKSADKKGFTNSLFVLNFIRYLCYHILFE